MHEFGEAWGGCWCGGYASEICRRVADQSVGFMMWFMVYGTVVETGVHERWTLREN